MVKGVSKNVIEINNLNSEYFERAIVIIKDSCPINGDALDTEARLIIGNEPPMFMKKMKMTMRMKMIICAVTGALFAVVMCGILYVLCQ